VIQTLLTRLGNPERYLPPVFHVAGTNGKGSTCAFLRAMLEAAGLRVHSATKPHLVRYNERIRLAGRLITDDALAPLLAEVLDAAENLGPSFFEVTTAALFLVFARTPADAAIVEVGLGGRFDATNVIPAPLVCGVASLGIDHEAFLLREEPGTPSEPIARIAFEKAGIARAGVPLVTQQAVPAAEAEFRIAARARNAPWSGRGRAWDAETTATALLYRDEHGSLELPLPSLAGPHQADNAALAVALIRHQSTLAVPPAAIAAGIRNARWPARLQTLGPGPLTARLPGRTVIVDGGHNAEAAQAVAVAMAREAPFDLVFGLMKNRRIADVLSPFTPLVRRAYAVPLQGHDHHDPREIATLARDGIVPVECNPTSNLNEALDRLSQDAAGAKTILIAGSLYLAGQALLLNREIPD
jgi:dihydrofolate synthase/folylpolyglutamate synthase